MFAQLPGRVHPARHSTVVPLLLSALARYSAVVPLLSLALVFLHQRCLVAAVRAAALGTLVLLILGAGSGAGTLLLLLHGLVAARRYNMSTMGELPLL